MQVYGNNRYDSSLDINYDAINTTLARHLGIY